MNLSTFETFLVADYFRSFYHFNIFYKILHFRIFNLRTDLRKISISFIESFIEFCTSYYINFIRPNQMDSRR